MTERCLSGSSSTPRRSPARWSDPALYAQTLPEEGGDTVWSSTRIKDVSKVHGQSLLTLLFDLIKSPELHARFH